MKKVEVVGTITHNWNEHSGYFWEWGDVKINEKEDLTEKILSEMPEGKKVKVTIEILED
ncbi:hypothetical protein Kirov_222 [Bacillus phage Kirov]|uniref:Uncharacterized protein n=1 Tax=Bacillus phage Kirov TaxID=2783539 RepID=A0A7U3NJZ9_9CAUD|nr:hypothetical protein PQE67_gp082 [Bacillus phage Kirov]QOV08421.1 hypothetical protein Kirov_222 [Bacillus phage Kirov]